MQYLPTYIPTYVTVVIVATVVTAVTVVTVVRSETNHATSHQKNLRNHIVYFLNFLSTFGKSNLTHLTTNVMFSGQRFEILAIFLVLLHFEFFFTLSFFLLESHNCH